VTLEPSNGCGVDPEALAHWLRAAGETVTPPLTLQRVGKGQSNLVLIARDDAGARWVVRRPPLGVLLETAHDIPREHRILAALQGTPVPVPHVVGLVGDPAVCSAPCLVMQHVDGRVVDEEATAEALAVEARQRMSEGLVDTLVALHAVEPDATGLGDLAVDAPYAARQLRRWSRQWEASKPAGPHPLDHLTPRLQRAVPGAEARRIVHGDLHPKNVIIGPDGSIRAALDWELCTLGDPLADLGTLLAYWPEPGDPPTLVFGATRLEGFLTRDELVARYRERSGRAVEDIAFWHVLGLWKLAIIAQGVFRRTQDEPLNRADGAPGSQGDVDLIGAQALALADRLGL
jgi:aminoglycoside phosphotransferase (APT) family kinase protein